jgi:hypothetical protein
VISRWHNITYVLLPAYIIYFILPPMHKCMHAYDVEMIDYGYIHIP